MEIIDLALYVDNVLIIADTHIGYEEALNKQGILIPRFQFKEIIKRLDGIFSKLKGRKIEKIVINGDVKHEFGTISEQEWKHTLQLLDYLDEHCKEIILIKGNHDTILGPIAKKRNVKVVDNYIINSFINDKELVNKKRGPSALFRKKSQKQKILVTHGHKLPDKRLLGDKSIKTIIIGHEHPAVSISDWPRVELVKCFLKGRYKGKKLIVMPSFNLVSEGTDILKEELLSPFLHQNINNFDVYVVEDKVYHFGKVRDLR